VAVGDMAGDATHNGALDAALGHRGLGREQAK
jgi:hypothetical protein